MRTTTPPVTPGVYETLLVRDGRPVLFGRHLRRFAASADGLGLSLPSRGHVADAVAAALAGLDPSIDRRLRLTAAATSAAASPDPAGGLPARLVVSLGPVADPPAAATVVTCPWIRNERSAVRGLKVLGSSDTVVAQRWARERGADEGLLLDSTGRVSEGLSSNLFAVVDGALVTPSLASGCLGGITREVLIEATGAAEVDLWATDLARAEEVFMSSSTRWVLPVARLDGRDLPVVGGRSAEAARSSEALADAESARDWSR